MRLRSLGPVFILGFFAVISPNLYGQSCFNTGLNGTVINLPCHQTCVNVPVKIPHLKSTSDYVITEIPYTPYAYTTPGGATDANIYADDKYSRLIPLPFNFCFYDSLYTFAVVGSNGLITFDTTNKSCDNAYTISQTIPLNTGEQCNQGGVYYPRAAVMGMYCDLDPSTTASPADRKIEWRVEGSAPCRKFIASYYHVGIYGDNDCGLLTPTSFQIVLYESTGIIEVFVEAKTCLPATGNGHAIMGLQNWARNKAIAGPGKNNTVWHESLKGYRFVPSGGVSRFVSCEVQTLAGAFIATGDTATTSVGTLDVTFPTFCPTGASGQYVVKTTFAACDNPGNQLVSFDTITINKTTSLDPTKTLTPTSCGLVGSGTATINLAAGIGTAPFTYIMTPGPVTQTNNGVFNNLTAGPYSVTVSDASGCSSVVPFTITSTGVLSVDFTTVNTKCVGASDGSITVNVPNATPPIRYAINGGSLGTSNVFTGLAPGTYFIDVRDNGGCSATFIPVTIDAGPSITMDYTSVATSCNGAANGSVTIVAHGTPPYQYAINGGAYQASPTFTGLQGNATYFVDVKDASSCTISFFPVDVPEGTGTVTGTATATGTTCAGVNNGSITATPTSGSGPYTYSINGGSSWQASNIFNGLASGSYNVLIREAGLCISSNIPVSVAAGSGLTATVTNTATTCAGVSNGTINVSPTSGTAPYTIILDGTRTQTGSPNTIFTGVGTGAHTVTIRDVNGCTTTTALSTTITAGAGYTASFTATATGCVGVNNGSLTITPQTPGTSPYTFVMNPGTVSHTGTANTIFNGLAPGSYSVVVTDAVGCQATINNMTITQGAGLTATLTNTATTCAGVSNGTVTVTPTSGTSPYTIVMDGTRTQTGSPNTTFTGVGIGSHTITITDAAGCTTSAALTTSVAAGTGYTANFTAVATGCVGVNNGSLTITPQTPGTSPYSFVMNPGSVTQTGAANTVFNGLASGTYSVVVTDAAGCQASINNMTVAQGAGLTGNLTATTTTCAGVNNGSVTVVPTSGTAPYTIVLDGTRTLTGNPTATFTGVGTGIHTATFTDANGCSTSTTLSITVTAGAGYTANFTAAATGCVGVNNGSLTITPQVPGTSPYTFVMNPGAVSHTGAANTVFNGLAPGTYSVVVTDAVGCQATINNMTIAQGAGLTATLTPSFTSCTGATNGSIVVTPGTGTAPFTIVLDGTRTQTGTPATTFTGVAAGSHSVTITDASGCTTSAPLTTTVATGTGYVTAVAATGTSCVGVNNGSFTLTPQTPPGTSPYSFVMSPGSLTQTGAITTTFANLAPGTYSAVVTDAAGCQSTVSNINITQGSGLTANSTATPATCFGAANGTISVTPTNGSGPYTFVMNGTVTQTGATSTTFTNLAANNYTITITDAAGCIIPAPITKTITQPAALTAAQPAASPVTCNGASNGTITVFPAGGTPPYNYSLDNVSFQTTNSFSVPQGNYVVYIKDANGCTLQFNNILITQPAVLNATIASTTNATCNGGSDGTILVTPTGGTAPYQYSVTGSNFQPSNTLNVISGTYSVTVKDANNCTFVIPNVVVGLTDNLTLATITPAAICEGTGTTLQLTTNATGFAWTYTGGPTLSSTSIANPVASPSTTTTYTVVASLGNCRKTDDVTVTVLPAPDADAGARGDICFGQNFQLEGSGGVSYSWSPTTYLDNPNIATPQVVRPDHTITYTLNVTDANNCKSLVGDNVTVNVTPPIQISASPVDTVVYAGAQFKMHVSSVATDYEWSPVTGLSNPYIAEPVVTAPGVGETVIYKVIATTSAGCQGEKFITVKVYEGPDIFVVTAFTPNGDGKNDNFIPFPVGIKQLNFFRVFNRWGQLMYSTTTLNQGWDGKLGGIEQQTGVYIWMVQGVTETGGIINKKGTVTLIR